MLRIILVAFTAWVVLTLSALEAVAEVRHVATSFCVHAGSQLHVADVNADGREDLICRDPVRLWIMYARGGEGSPYPLQVDWWLDTNFCTHAGARSHFTDVNGDGRADFVCRDPGRIWINYADAAGRFSGRPDWYVDTNFCTHTDAELHFVDTNGDRRADLICRDPGRIWGVHANAQGRYTPQSLDWYIDTNFCTHPNAEIRFADLNGDGRSDILCRDPARLWVSYADTSGVIHGRPDWFVDTTWCTRRDERLHVGDFNGDGRSDFLCVGARHMRMVQGAPGVPFNEDSVWMKESMWCDETRSRLIVARVSGARADLMCHDRNWLSLLRSNSEGRFAPPAGDRDNDGLHDWWEINYRHEFATSTGALSPDRRDLIWIPVLDPAHGVSEPQIRTVGDNMTRFFAEVPVTNPDGSTGITLHVVPTVIAAGTCEMSRHEVRLLHFPVSYRGKAHGTKLCRTGGGGGQGGVWADFSEAGLHWQTIVHELGHHFGLTHHPLTTDVPSPLYASLMNYDYMMGVNGRVQFSPGRFASVRLDERNLNEELPFPASELAFLSQPPYRFEVAAVSATHSSVDFNRNGVHSERGVRADINSGSSIWLSREVRTGTFTVGGLSMVSLDGTLLLFIPQPERGVEWTSDETDDSVSPTMPGRILVQSYRDTTSDLRPARTLIPRGVTGVPHAATARGNVFLVWPHAGGHRLRSFALAADGQLRAASQELAVEGTVGRQLVLVRRSQRPVEELWLFEWDPATLAVDARRVIIEGDRLRLSERTSVRASDRESHDTSVRSNGPIGITANADGSRVYLVTSAASPSTWNRTRYRMKLRKLAQRSGQWVSEEPFWLTSSPGDYAGTNDRPEVIFDASMGRRGDLLVYFRRDARFDDNKGWMDLVRIDFDVPLTPSPDSDPLDPPFRWTKALLGNSWVVSRSAPAAALYGNDVALSFRWHAQDIQNMVLLQLAASGIVEKDLTDFDDLAHIASVGLREPLRQSSW